MYTFSDKTVAEFYGTQFYSISDESGKVVAYSQKVFAIPDEVRLIGESTTLIFEKAVIWGGVIRGGVIWGGVIRGGVIEITLLQIQGSRHFCYGTPNPETGEIELGIGCHIHPIQYWLDSYSEIGQQNGYSEYEIVEYSEYIQMYAKRYLK